MFEYLNIFQIKNQLELYVFKFSNFFHFIYLQDTYYKNSLIVFYILIIVHIF